MRRVRALLGALVAAIGLILLASSAAAQVTPDRRYVGLGVVQADASDFCGPGGVPGLALGSCDNKDAGWRIFGGVLLNENLALEVAYSTSLNLRGSAIVSGMPRSVERSDILIDGLLVGLLPLGEKISVLGKAGIVFWDTTLRTEGSRAWAHAGVDFTIGLGVQLELSRKVGLRVDWQSYNDVGHEGVTGVTDLGIFGAGVYFRF